MSATIAAIRKALTEAGLADPAWPGEKYAMKPALAAGAAVLFASASIALGAPSVDPAQGEAIIRRCASIYHEPVDGKSRPCACAFYHAKNGSLCGTRSAHDRPGGASPICLLPKVTPELLRDFRTNEQAVLRERCHYHGR